MLLLRTLAALHLLGSAAEPLRSRESGWTDCDSTLQVLSLGPGSSPWGALPCDLKRNYGLFSPAQKSNGRSEPGSTSAVFLGSESSLKTKHHLSRLTPLHLPPPGPGGCT